MVTVDGVKQPDKSISLIDDRREHNAEVRLWSKILNHKWLLSEKIGRDMGSRTSCIDFLKNMEQAHEEYSTYKRWDTLKDLGAQMINKGM